MPRAIQVEEFKPRIHIDDKQLPVIKSWEVGRKYKILLEVKQVDKSEREEDGKTLTSGGFEILKAKDATGKKSFSTQAVKEARKGLSE